MTNRPDFIDNRDGNTLAQALKAILSSGVNDTSFIDGPLSDVVRISTAFFSPAGFAHIADQLRFIPEVRLLLGADPATKLNVEQKRLDETPESYRTRRIRAGLGRMDDELRRERDSIPFMRSSILALNKLIAALRAGNMEVRRYEKAFLHAKAYLVASNDNSRDTKDGVIIGSSNLTGAGLTDNLELNLGCYEDSVVEQATVWFDDLWEEAVPYELSVVFEDVLRPRMPWQIFVRVLWQLYGQEVDGDSEVDQNLPLTSFQKHGVARAMRLLGELGGAIVADEVGLGKTFIAGEILQYYTEKRQRVLLICPAALRDSTWKRFLTKYQLFVECLSFEQLANDKQLRDKQRPNADQDHLQRDLNEYQLIIVDEAHNYRNPDAPTRAAALRRLMYGRHRDLLLLTATPVNNSLWDLYHLIRYFLRQDTSLADRGVVSMRKRFELAMREDPSSLNPDTLYPIIDATTVKRTRQFVKKHYANDTIEGEDGVPQPIVFPQPNALSVRYKLDDLLPGFFDKLEQALDPDSNEALVFARYMPDVYLLDSQEPEDTARGRAVSGLLRSGLLKRFESSVYAFRCTVEKMVQQHSIFLNALDSGKVVTTAFMSELSANDETDFEDLLAESGHSSDANLYDIKRLKAHVLQDRSLLRQLYNQAATIGPDRDPKLKVLASTLVEIAENAKREGISSIDESQKRKVIVF
ncbi:MAG: hypothetical protein F4Z66_08625 [Gammaproteobacteria bacterium]|nr:hypothetical protein [Gammaproteobacteria bacterium]